MRFEFRLSVVRGSGSAMLGSHEDQALSVCGVRGRLGFVDLGA